MLSQRRMTILATWSLLLTFYTRCASWSLFQSFKRLKRLCPFILTLIYEMFLNLDLFTPRFLECHSIERARWLKRLICRKRQIIILLVTNQENEEHKDGQLSSSLRILSCFTKPHFHLFRVDTYPLTFNFPFPYYFRLSF